MQEVKWRHSALALSRAKAYNHKIFYLWSAATTTIFFFNIKLSKCLTNNQASRAGFIKIYEAYRNSVK